MTARNLMSGVIALVACACAYAAEDTAQPGDSSARQAQQPMLDFGVPCNATTTPPRKGQRDQIAPPRPTHAPPPDYPPFARRAEQEGTVMVQAYVTDSGQVGQTRLQASSGWPRLDDSALNSLRDWKFNPGTINGKPTCMWVTIPLVFRLTEYTSEQLKAANSTPQSVALAHALLGDTLLQETISAASQSQPNIEAQVAGQIMSTLSSQAERAKDAQDISAMLAIEFTPGEIDELNALFNSPVARKYFGLQRKLQPEIRSRQQQFGLLSYCVLSSVGQSLGWNEDGLRPESVPANLLQSLPRVIKEIQPYCSCMASRTATMRDAAAAAKICGEAPRIVW